MNLQKLAISLIIILSLKGCSQNINKEEKTDVEKMNLKGKISQIIEQSYFTENKFGSIHKTEFINEVIYNFDKNGNLVKEENRSSITKNKKVIKFDDFNRVVEKLEYNAEDVEFRKETFKYDSQSNLIEKCNYYSGDLESKYIFNYDNRNNKIEETSYYRKEIDSKIKNKYNDENKLIEELFFDELGKLNLKIVHKYDDFGNRILTIKNRLLEKLIFEIKSEYDSKNNLIEEEFFENGKQIGRNTYKYDDEGMRLQFKRYSNKGVMTYFENYKYDLNKNVIEEEVTNELEYIKNTTLLFVGGSKNINYNKTVERKTYEYDENNNIVMKGNYTAYLLGYDIQKEIYFEGGLKYELDSEKNWIVKKEIDNEEVFQITERQINYF